MLKLHYISFKNDFAQKQLKNNFQIIKIIFKKRAKKLLIKIKIKFS